MEKFQKVHICGCCGAAFVYKGTSKQLDDDEVHVCEFCQSGHIDEENPECVTLNGSQNDVKLDKEDVICVCDEPNCYYKPENCHCKPNIICKQCVAHLFPRSKKEDFKNTEFPSVTEEEIITSLDDRMI